MPCHCIGLEQGSLEYDDVRLATEIECCPNLKLHFFVSHFVAKFLSEERFGWRRIQHTR